MLAYPKLAPLALVLAASLVSESSSSSAAPVVRTTMDSAASLSSGPQMVAGRLTPPTALPATVIANQLLAARPELLRGVPLTQFKAASTRTLERGSAVHYQQSVNGVPVLGRSMIVRVDGNGVVRWVRSNVVTIPDGFDTTPTVTTAAAHSKTLGALASATMVDRVSDSRLGVVASFPSRPTLVWQTDVATLGQHLWRVTIDAKTGAVISKVNLTKTAQGLVFDANPADFTIVERTLTHLPDGATTLSDDNHVVISCREPTECVQAADGSFFNRCDFVQSVADDNGDFLFAFPEELSDPNDSFAETQMYFHLSRASAWLSERGFPGLDAEPMLSVANFREPVACNGPTPTTSLTPLNNAFFTPAGLFGDGRGMLVFGQGVVDFSYDSDIIYHELGHAVIGTVSGLGGGPRAGVFGLYNYDSSMHEGLADYIATAISNESRVGEFMEAVIGFPVRDLAGVKRCPDFLTGEVHDDGEPIAAALWAIRESLPNAADRDTMDAAVLTAIGTLGSNETFETAASAVLAELEVVLGEPVAQSALAIFEDRGFGSEECVARIVEMTPGSPRSPMFANGDFGTGQLLPGPFQFRLKDIGSVSRLSFRLNANVNPVNLNDVSLRLVIKTDGTPIQFSAPEDPNDPRFVVHDGEFEIEFSRTAQNTFVAELPQRITNADGINMALLDGTPFSWVATQIDVQLQDAGPKTDDLGEKNDAGEDTGGCSTSSTSGGGALALLLVLGLSLTTRRRKRS